MSNHTKQRDRKRGGSRYYKTPRSRPKRPKTFKTEEAAKAWADKQNLKDYKLVNLKNEESGQKKIRVE